MLKEFYNNAAADADIERFVHNFDHHSEFFRSHYFNILERIAGREPALRSTAYDDGFSVATSYQTIVGVSEQPELFSNRQGFRVLPRSVMPLLYPSDADGAEHNFFRQILNPQFTPAA